MVENLSKQLPVKNEHGKQAVNARDLHKFLCIRKDFTSWMKVQVERCDLTKVADYQAFTQKVKSPNGFGYTMKSEFALSLDAAKEIAMMSQTEKGKQARRYFIECEKIAKSKTPALPDFSDPAKAARAWADQYEQTRQQTQRAIEAEQRAVELSDTVASMKPKADYCDLILASRETVAMTQIAQDYGMSAKAFNVLLRNLGIQHKVAGQWILYAKYLPLGYVQSYSFPIEHRDGRRDTKMLSKWTQKGRLFLYEELKKYGFLPLIEKEVGA